MTTTQSIALNRLVQSRANVRRTGQSSGIEALMASIAAHGLRQNLNVMPTTGGRFAVVAGGRRLIALKKLARAGTVASDIAVPCLVLSDADNATEISLAENQMRQEMHPDDQCAAFQSLIESGMPVEDVAARFGVSSAVVRYPENAGHVCRSFCRSKREARQRDKSKLTYPLCRYFCRSCGAGTTSCDRGLNLSARRCHR